MEPRQDDRDQITKRASKFLISTFHHGGLSQGAASGFKQESICMEC